MGRSHGLVTLAAWGFLLGTAACAGAAPDDDVVPVTPQAAVADCTVTLRYWIEHPEAWPYKQFMVGTQAYSRGRLLKIFATPPNGNGLTALSHQLVAAKLNEAAGAKTTEVSAVIAAADALVGDLVLAPFGDGYLSPADVSSLLRQISEYNQGRAQFGRCAIETQPAVQCGNGVLEAGEACDDFNVKDGDGCSSTCQIPRCGDGDLDSNEPCDDGKHDDGGNHDDDEQADGGGCSSACPSPRCGDGHLDPGEQCDDGNVIDGDGCTPTCRIPRCGDGTVDWGEYCDDGNVIDGDGCTSTCTFDTTPMDAGPPPPMGSG